jgi:hypothetical protein
LNTTHLVAYSGKGGIAQCTAQLASRGTVVAHGCKQGASKLWYQHNQSSTCATPHPGKAQCTASWVGVAVLGRQARQGTLLGAWPCQQRCRPHILTANLCTASCVLLCWGGKQGKAPCLCANTVSPGHSWPGPTPLGPPATQRSLLPVGSQPLLLLLSLLPVKCPLPKCSAPPLPQQASPEPLVVQPSAPP